MDLSTTYLGLKLKNPIVPSASPLSHNLDTMKRLEDAGAAAIVMYSPLRGAARPRGRRAGTPSEFRHGELRGIAQLLPRGARLQCRAGRVREPLLAIGPAMALLGMSYPFLQRVIQTDPAFVGGRVGGLQTANIAGGLVGSLLTGFWLLPLLGTSGTFRVRGGAGLVFPLLAVTQIPRLRLAAIAAPALGVAAVLGAILAFPAATATRRRSRAGRGSAQTTIPKARPPAAQRRPPGR